MLYSTKADAAMFPLKEGTFTAGLSPANLVADTKELSPMLHRVPTNYFVESRVMGKPLREDFRDTAEVVECATFLSE
eukprot:3336001-Pyramimonas_sp.AAC.1